MQGEGRRQMRESEQSFLRLKILAKGLGACRETKLDQDWVQYFKYCIQQYFFFLDKNNFFI